MSNKPLNHGEHLPNNLGSKVKSTLKSVPLAAALICGNPSVNTPIALGTAAAVTITLTSCDPDDGPLGPKEIDKNDAPKLESSEKNVEAEKGTTLSFDGLNLKLGNTVIAEFSDDYSKVLTATITINGNSVTLPYTLNETGVFNWSLTVKDSGNGTATSKTTTASGTITVKETPPNENQAPKITPEKYSDGATIKVGGGFRFFHEGNSISIESQGKTEKCFSYSDRETSTENLKPTFTIDGQSIEYGKWYTEGKTFSGVIEDDGTIENQDKKSETKKATITYTLNSEILDNDVFSGLDKLNSLQLKVWEDTDLLNGVNGINGWKISKVEIEQNGQRTEISSTNGKYNYTPTQEGNVNIIIIGTTEAGVSYEVKSNPIEVKENVKEYNAVIPAKAESMYQKFNTTNDRAFERRGAYETKALAQSLKNRNACNVLIFKEGVYTDGETDIHPWRGGDGDGHGEEIYGNIADGSGTKNNILATRGNRIDVENNINNSSLKDQPLIITTSEETLGQETLNELLNSPKYKAFKNLGNDPDILTFTSGGNVKNNFNYVFHESITNKSDFGSGGYEQSSATDTNNGIVRVEYGISKNISKHGVYEGNHKTTSCAFISKDNYIISRNCVSYPSEKANVSEERTKNSNSQAAPAAAAMARNVYDICHPLGIVEHLQDTRFLMEKYATKVPSTREDIAPDGTIIEDVPNGYVYTMNLLALIDNEVFPAIEKKCTSVNGECTILYTPPNGLQLAYQGAGVEYQDNNGVRHDTNGINPENYVDKPQRINYALRSKTYKNKGGITIYCMVPDGVLDYGDKKGGYIVKKDNANIPTN